jgi:hypothetical protein
MNDLIIVGWFITLFLLLVLTTRIEKLEDAERVRRSTDPPSTPANTDENDTDDQST